jgi:hypothetical protein
MGVIITSVIIAGCVYILQEPIKAFVEYVRDSFNEIMYSQLNVDGESDPKVALSIRVEVSEMGNSNKKIYHLAR